MLSLHFCIHKLDIFYHILDVAAHVMLPLMLQQCRFLQHSFTLSYLGSVHRCLTSLAVLASEPERAVAAEGPPQVDAGSSVQTRVVVAEMALGRASWEDGGMQRDKNRLISSLSLSHQGSREGFIAGALIISFRLRFPAALIMLIISLPLPGSPTWPL